jgi:hypothetical protein
MVVTLIYTIFVSSCITLNSNVIFIADNKFKNRICYDSQIFKHLQKLLLIMPVASV